MLNEDCNCNGPKIMLNEGKNDILLSEGLRYHVQEGKMLIHNIYRPLSSNYFALFPDTKWVNKNNRVNIFM